MQQSMQTMSVTVPPGVEGGQAMTVNVNGQDMRSTYLQAWTGGPVRAAQSQHCLNPRLMFRPAHPLTADTCGARRFNS